LCLTGFFIYELNDKLTKCYKWNERVYTSSLEETGKFMDYAFDKNI
jgi:hypothetical protein